MDRVVPYIKERLGEPKALPALALGLIALAVALFLGVRENPPGMLIMYAGLVALGIAAIPPWTDGSKYGTLLAVSAVSLPVSALVYTISETLIENLSQIPVVSQLIKGVGVLALSLGLGMAPALMLIGLVGGITFWIRNRL